MVDLDGLEDARREAVKARKALQGPARTALFRAASGAPFEELEWVDTEDLEAAGRALEDAVEFIKEGLALIDDIFDRYVTR